MALHNHWWLLIWTFLFGGASLILDPKHEEIVLGKKVMRWNWLSALIFVIPFIIWAAWRTNAFGDTAAYRQQFLNAPASFSNLGSYLSSQAKDRGYALILVAFKTLISRSDVFFFFFIAAVQMICLVTMYRKYSENYWLSIFLFIASTDYISWMHNGMRQFLTAALLFACIPLIIRRKYILMLIIALLISQIHLSSLIFLPFIFVVNGKAWNWKTVLFILGILIAVIFVDRVTGIITEAMEDTAYSGEIYQFINDDGANLFRVLFYSVPAVMTFVFRGYIDRADDPIINMCANLSIIGAGFYVFSYFTSGMLIGRLPIYFTLANYILIPWLIREVFNKESAVLVTASIIAVYSAFFYYQVGVSWGLL